MEGRLLDTKHDRRAWVSTWHLQTWAGCLFEDTTKAIPLKCEEVMYVTQEGEGWFRDRCWIWTGWICTETMEVGEVLIELDTRCYYGMIVSWIVVMAPCNY